MSRTRSSVISERERVVEESRSVSSPQNSVRLKAEAEPARVVTVTSTAKARRRNALQRDRGRHLLRLEASLLLLNDAIRLVTITIVMSCTLVLVQTTEMGNSMQLQCIVVKSGPIVDPVYVTKRQKHSSV